MEALIYKNFSKFIFTNLLNFLTAFSLHFYRCEYFDIREEKIWTKSNPLHLILFLGVFLPKKEKVADPIG